MDGIQGPQVKREVLMAELTGGKHVKEPKLLGKHIERTSTWRTSGDGVLLRVPLGECVTSGPTRY